MTLLLALACNDDDVQNADITALSQQVEALNALTEQLEAELASANAEIESLRSDVDGNQSLREDVVANTSAIASMNQRMTALEESQGQQDTLLEGLSVDVASNTDAILLNRDDIEDNTDAVGTLAADVADNTDAVAENTSDIGALESELGTLDGDALTDLLSYLSVDTSTDAVTFSGANVLIQSGVGSTAGAVNGTGNLIVGYDEGGSNKTGSHNLVVGPGHEYSSYGGIVGGYYNDLSGTYSSVLGGSYNEASGTTSVVVGGYFGEASGHRSSILGGYLNDATGSYSTVYGGYYEDASSTYAYAP